MSFVDELRQIQPPDYHKRWVDNLTKCCLYAVKESCYRKQQLGLHALSGEFYYSSNDYGTYLIEDTGTYWLINDKVTLSDFELLKTNFQNGLKEMGFSYPKVSIRVRNAKTAVGYTWTGKQKLRETGTQEACLYIEVEW